MAMFIPDLTNLQDSLAEFSSGTDQANESANISSVFYHRCMPGDFLVERMTVSAPGSNFVALSMVVASFIYVLGKMYGLREEEKPMAVLDRCSNASRQEFACGYSPFKIIKMLDSTPILMHSAAVLHTPFPGGGHAFRGGAARRKNDVFRDQLAIFLDKNDTFRTPPETSKEDESKYETKTLN